MIEIPKKEPLNIVPFIDIMLVLLAMVLSISTFIAKGEIEIKLPQADSAETPHQADAPPALIQIDAAGTILWAGEKTDLEGIERHLSALGPKDRVVLRIDREARFDDFIQVIDLLRRNKHENFTVETEKRGGR